MRNAAMPVEKPDFITYDSEIAVDTGKEQKPDLKLIKKRNTRARIKAVLWIALIFAAFFLVTSRYSNLTKLNYEIADIKSSLEEQKSINSALAVELDQKTNIVMIRHSAEAELGMHEPNNHQIIYMDVPRANKVTVEETTDDGIDETIGFFENIRAFIGGS
jgi:cell division protein FtsL